MIRGPKLYGSSRGYLEFTADDGTRKEGDTFTCQHCSFVTYIKPFADPADVGGFCRSCGGLICKGCAAKGGCQPIEEKLRLAEEKGAALRSYGF